jgi:hypothetical protein
MSVDGHFDDATILAMCLAFDRTCRSLQAGGVAATVQEISRKLANRLQRRPPSPRTCAAILAIARGSGGPAKHPPGWAFPYFCICICRMCRTKAAACRTPSRNSRKRRKRKSPKGNGCRRLIDQLRRPRRVA